MHEFLLAVYWRFWQGQLLPYAPQAKRAPYAKLATALFLKALRQVVDSTAGDVVQLVRTLPCRWLESHTVTAEPQNQLPHRTSITLLEWTAQLPKSGTARRASLKRFVKFAAQITSVSSTITSVSSTICPSSKNFRNSVSEPSRIAAAPRVTRSAYRITAFSLSSNSGLRS